MCYFTYIATNKTIEVHAWTNEYMSIEKNNPIKEKNNIIKKYTKKKYLYFLSSKSKCSCDFRYGDKKLGFSKPENWYPESEAQIKGTKLIYKLIKEILKNNKEIEILPLWITDIGKKYKKMKIKLSEINEDEFRFFDNIIFLISK